MLFCIYSLFSFNNNSEIERRISNMTTKELLYLEDALGHAQFFMTKCNETVSQIKDAELKLCVQQVCDKNKQIFDSLYGLL